MFENLLNSFFLGHAKGPIGLLNLTNGWSTKETGRPNRHLAPRLELSTIVSPQERGIRDARLKGLTDSLKARYGIIVNCTMREAAESIRDILNAPLPSLYRELTRVFNNHCCFIEVTGFTFILATILNQIHKDIW